MGEALLPALAGQLQVRQPFASIPNHTSFCECFSRYPTTSCVMVSLSSNLDKYTEMEPI